MKRKLLALILCVTIAMPFLVSSQITMYAETTTNATVIHRGTVGEGGAPWRLYSDGTLIVESGFINWTGSVSPWNQHVRSISRIVFTGEIIAGSSLSRLFHFNWISFSPQLEPRPFYIEGFSYFDTSNVTDMSYMFASSLVRDLDLSSFDTGNVTNMSGMFSNTWHLRNLDISTFDTNNVINMSRMFSGSAVTYLNLSSFDTSNVVDMSRMFQWSQITNLDLSNFNPKNVIDMSNMFERSALTDLDLSNFNTLNVINMSEMFRGTNHIINIDLSGLDTRSVTNMSGMFRESTVVNLGLSNLDNCSVTDMTDMFRETNHLTKLNLSNFKTPNVTDMGRMFYRSGITNLDLFSFDTSEVTNMSDMFYRSAVAYLDLSSFDTSNVTNMSRMFSRSSVTYLDLNHFNTSNVINMNGMFNWSNNLTAIHLSNFNTKNVADMGNMFSLSPIEILDTLNFNTSNVTNMSGMFSNTNLTELDLSNFDTSNVTQMGSMFSGLRNLTSLDISSFDTSNVIGMSYMFSSISVETLDLSNFDTSNVTNMRGMFRWANTELDLSNFDTRNVRNMESMFEWAHVENLDLSNFYVHSDTQMGNIFWYASPLYQLTLGEHFHFGNNFRHSAFGRDAALLHRAFGTRYSVRWQNIGTGTVCNPQGNFIFSAGGLMANFDGATMADTWVWSQRYRIYVTPSPHNVLLNGETINITAFNIKGNNYFRLRDIAYLLNGTSSQFNVTWSETLRTEIYMPGQIYLTLGQAYIPLGTEMTARNMYEYQLAIPSGAVLFLNFGTTFETVYPLAYTINGYNYFMLRNLGDIVGFEVDWCEATSTVLINTN